VTQIPTICTGENVNHCHHTLKQFFCIAFTPEDMQVKGKRDRPLYYTGYIRSSEVSRMQVDLKSALSTMPRRVMQHLGVPTHRLSVTQTTIYGFNANGTCLMRKIKLKCQIGDLKFKVACYIIDVDTLYNLLLGRPWIHRYSIVPFTLHQVMKYANEEGKVRMLITKRHPFKGSIITSLIPSSIRILLRLMKIHTWKNRFW